MVTARSGISTSSPRRNRLYARSPSMCTALAAGGTWRIAPRKPFSDRRTASSSVVAAVSARSPSGSSVVDVTPKRTAAR